MSHSLLDVHAFLLRVRDLAYNDISEQRVALADAEAMHAEAQDALMSFSRQAFPGPPDPPGGGAQVGWLL
jgi:hypothetical protein